MKITSVAVKNSKSCSARDGIAWSCSLWLNGKRAALVRNGGDGGPTDFDWRPSGQDYDGGEIAKAFDAYAVAQPPCPAEPEYHMPEIACDADILVSRLCDELEEQRKIKRLCKTSVICRHPDGGLVQFKCKPTPANIKAIQARNPSYKVLN